MCSIWESQRSIRLDFTHICFFKLYAYECTVAVEVHEYVAHSQEAARAERAAGASAWAAGGRAATRAPARLGRRTRTATRCAARAGLCAEAAAAGSFSCRPPKSRPPRSLRVLSTAPPLYIPPTLYITCSVFSSVQFSDYSATLDAAGGKSGGRAVGGAIGSGASAYGVSAALQSMGYASVPTAGGQGGSGQAARGGTGNSHHGGGAQGSSSQQSKAQQKRSVGAQVCLTAPLSLSFFFF